MSRMLRLEVQCQRGPAVRLVRGGRARDAEGAARSDSAASKPSPALRLANPKSREDAPTLLGERLIVS